MPKEKKEIQKEVLKSNLSMKEALSGIEVKTKSFEGKEKKAFRDVFWEYPAFLIKAFMKSVPFSYILLFSVIGIFLSILLQSGIVSTLFGESNSNDSFVEGFLGSSTTLNPLFVSVNDVDKSIQNLVFEKFIDLDEDGSPLANIAKSWSVSDDGLAYEFEISKGFLWHDGESLDAEDVFFTFSTALSLYEDYGYDSIGGSIAGISVEMVDAYTVRFKLEEENPTFLEAISVYIVPEHRLRDVALLDMPFDIFAKYPLGCGRYSVVRNDDNYISLTDSPVDDVDPEINEVVFRLYADYSDLEGAFRNGVLDSFGLFDKEAISFITEYPGFVEYSKSLEMRNKLLFLNNRSGLFENQNVRLAINYLIDVEKLLDDASVGGSRMTGPISQSSWAYNGNVAGYSYNHEKAIELLGSVGYKKNDESGYLESEDGEILSFGISYLDNELNNRLIDSLTNLLSDEGIVLQKEALNFSQLSQEIVATRNFEMLLYEIETMIDPDQYNLWHSLKANYPDLNISGYEYERVDILLEEARGTTDREVRKDKYGLFQKYLLADAPVVFLYNPQYTYFVDSDFQGINLDSMNYPYQRFDTIQDWRID